MSRMDTEKHIGNNESKHIEGDSSDGFTVSNLCIDERGGDPPLPADGLQQWVEHS